MAQILRRGPVNASPILDGLVEALDRNAHRTALVWNSGTLTHGELIDQSRRLAGWIASRGVDVGDTVAIDLPNGAPCVVAYFGCLLGGYRFVPVPTDLTEDDRAYVIERSGALLVVDDPEVVMGAQVPADGTNSPAGVDAGCVFFTSGTTARPKGVMHRVESLLANAVAFNSAAGIDETVRSYHALPMGYMAGFLNTVLSPLLAGGTVLLAPKFTPATALDFWPRALAWDANSTWLTPTMAALLCRLARDVDAAARVGQAMKNIYCGTAPLPDPVRSDFRRLFGCALRESYGTSEALLVSVQTPEQAGGQTGAGSLLAGVELASREAAGQGGPELLVRSPWLLQRYLTQDGECSPLTAQGALPTGDTGSLADGQLTITGRLKDLIIRGGFNVSPVRIESVIMAEDGVADCAVIGVPDDFWGEVTVACLVAGSNSQPDLVDCVRGRCLRELSDGMRPDRYEFFPRLPRTVTGKVRKNELRALLGLSSQHR